MLTLLVFLVAFSLCYGIVKLVTVIDNWQENRIIATPPVPGETWRYKKRSDPWGNYTRYTIVDVLDGWVKVKYRMPHGSISTDKLSYFTRKLSYFTRYYEKMTPEAIAAVPLPSDD